MPNKTAAFDIASAANTFNISQSLTQTTTSLAKLGPGTLVLGGTTTVSEGMLYVTGTISGTTIVNIGGTLSGDGGILSDITVNSGGIFSPPGASHISATNPFNTGTLNFGTGSIFQFEIETDTPP